MKMEITACALSVVLLCLVLRFFVENSLPHYRDTAIELISGLCSRATEILGLLLTGERFYTVWVRICEELEPELQTSAAEMEMKTGSVIACAALCSSGPREMKRVMMMAAAEAGNMSARDYARLRGAYAVVLPGMLEGEEKKGERNKGGDV